MKKLMNTLYVTSENSYLVLDGENIVIYDDRKARPGAMFADADLLGVPVRVVVSPRNLAENVVEISTRDKSIDKQKTPVDQAVTEVQNIINKLTADINSKVNK